MKHKINIQLFCLSILLSCFSLLQAQQVTYGFEQDLSNPLRITAVAYPDFTSDNVTISTAVFTFLMPQDVVTLSFIEPAPASGSFNNHTGEWIVQKLTPAKYASIGLNAADLEGNDVFQVVLQNAPELNDVVAGQALPLFSFELADDCIEGSIEVLTNDSDVQQAVRNNLNANFNNQMSMSVDDAPSFDIYQENDVFTYSIDCPMASMVSTSSPELGEMSLNLRPNPVSEYLEVLIQTDFSSDLDLVVYDAKKVIALQQEDGLVRGENLFRLDVHDLPSGSYMLVAKTKKATFKRKFVVVN